MGDVSGDTWQEETSSSEEYFKALRDCFKYKIFKEYFKYLSDLVISPSLRKGMGDPCCLSCFKGIMISGATT